MEFNLVNLRIYVQADNPLLLCLRMTSMGEKFSAACKQAACRCATIPCDRCNCTGNCPWYHVFAQELAADPVALRRHQKPPLPFVFSFPRVDELCESPGIIECGLVVIGRAIPCLEMLLEGFAAVLAGDDRQEQCEIVRISCCDYQGSCVSLKGHGHAISLENLVVLSADDLLKRCPWECDRIVIRLITPLRLMADGRLLDRFDFRRFACSLMRRVSSLAYYYADYEFDCDFGMLALRAADCVCTEDHFSSRSVSGGNKRLTGITGSGSFKGDFSGLMPFLVLGGFVHIGKGAAFGLGAFEVSAIKS